MIPPKQDIERCRPSGSGRTQALRSCICRDDAYDRNRAVAYDRRACVLPLSGTRRGTALFAALFVMSVSSMTVLAILNGQTSQYAALSNTVAYDEARYLAEAATPHGLATLEDDFSFRGTIPRTEFPKASSRYYSALVEDGSDGTVIVTGTGESNDFVRTVSVIVKQGG